MWKRMAICLCASMSLFVASVVGQSNAQDSAAIVPADFSRRVDRMSGSLNKQLDRQTEKYMRKMARREERLLGKLQKVDSAGASRLFAGSAGKYAQLAQQLQNDTGHLNMPVGKEYLPYLDSLKGSLAFLRQHPQFLRSGNESVQKGMSQLQALQAKMQQADQIKEYLRERRQQIGDYISQHSKLPSSMGAEYKHFSQDAYYYSQQVRQYKETLENPDEMEKKALAALNKLPAFQDFMKKNSQLAGLFSIPGDSPPAAALAGLQTRDQLSGIIQSQVASAGAGGPAALQSGLQSARSQLDAYKDKLAKLGENGGDIDMPDFRPNTQKTKSFWKRLEYGANFQTTKSSSYFPTVTDLALSVGYKLSDAGTVGIGASYKLGWGTGFDHIALTSQGVGFRSFVDVKLKGSFFVSGGFEYNYNRPFRSVQQVRRWDDWTRSGLVGLSKTVSMKNRVFKKTKVQVLWDFLSYQQTPRTQALVVRVGYNF